MGSLKERIIKKNIYILKSRAKEGKSTKYQSPALFSGTGKNQGW